VGFADLPDLGGRVSGGDRRTEPGRVVTDDGGTGAEPARRRGPAHRRRCRPPRRRPPAVTVDSGLSSALPGSPLWTACSRAGAGGQRATAPGRVQQGRGLVGLVKGTDVGA